MSFGRRSSCSSPGERRTRPPAPSGRDRMRAPASLCQQPQGPQGAGPPCVCPPALLTRRHAVSAGAWRRTWWAVSHRARTRRPPCPLPPMTSTSRCPGGGGCLESRLVWVFPSLSWLRLRPPPRPAAPTTCTAARRTYRTPAAAVANRAALLSLAPPAPTSVRPQLAYFFSGSDALEKYLRIGYPTVRGGGQPRAAAAGCHWLAMASSWDNALHTSPLPCRRPSPVAGARPLHDSVRPGSDHGGQWHRQ